MSKVIEFLETLGQDARLRHATGSELQSALTCEEIAPELQAAILRSDRNHLDALLGARTNVVCGVFPGKEDDDDKKGPAPDDDEVTLQSTVRCVASAG